MEELDLSLTESQREREEREDSSSLENELA
jgi:hypothetical protein